jgi:hypothetical protein
MKQLVNVFAQIGSKLDELKQVGRRIHLEGAEMVYFGLSEE